MLNIVAYALCLHRDALIECPPAVKLPLLPL
jgi:hypothetical protein